MQHYQVPARLLDWTESPFIALYFAVTSAHFKIDTRGVYNFKDDAAVWVLDPISWNRHALAHQSCVAGALSDADDTSKLAAAGYGGDLLPASHTTVKLVESVIMENGGYEKKQIQRRTDHRVSQAG